MSLFIPNPKPLSNPHYNPIPILSPNLDPSPKRELKSNPNLNPDSKPRIEDVEQIKWQSVRKPDSA